MDKDVVGKCHTAKVQRTPTGIPLGACIAIGAEYLTFVDPDTKYLEIKMRPCAGALHITIEAAEVEVMEA